MSIPEDDYVEQKLNTLLEKIEGKIQELRAANTESNQVLKDLKAERKACEAWIREQQDAINNQIVAHIREELKRLGPAVEKAVKDARARINKQFDELGAILMGVDKKQKDEPFKDIVRDWMERNQL